MSDATRRVWIDAEYSEYVCLYKPEGESAEYELLPPGSDSREVLERALEIVADWYVGTSGSRKVARQALAQARAELANGEESDEDE